MVGALGWTEHEERERGRLAIAVTPARATFASRGEGRAIGIDSRREHRVVLAGKLANDGVTFVAGDWLGLRAREGDPMVAARQGSPIPIDHVFSRRTSLVRKEAGGRARPQVLAANVDTVLVVSPLDLPFHARKVERFVAMGLAGGARVVIVLSKADLCADLPLHLEAARSLGPIEVVVASARDGRGMDQIRTFAGAGETVTLVGPSGAGKSALANFLLGREAQREGEVRVDDGKGRHTTAHRELFLLDGGGMVLDTPGLRELALWSDEEEGPAGFDEVSALAARCRFTDCAHDTEPGCAVRAAVVEGTLDAARFAAWTKLAAEGRALERRVSPEARRAERQRMKAIIRAQRAHRKR